MAGERAAWLALLLLGCSGEPEADGGTNGVGATGAMPHDMDMPANPSTTTSSTSTGTTSSSAGGVGGTGQASGSTATSGGGGSSFSAASSVSSTTGAVTTGEGASGGTSSTSVGGSGGTGNEPGDDRCAVKPVTEEFRENYDDLDPFYQKYADANGLPVVSSLAPSDAALERACELVIDMTSARPDVLAELIRKYVRFAIIAEDELTNDIPEFAYLDDAINERARGLGGVPAASCAEESILCNTALDPWRGEGICVHEFAHTISMGGLFAVDPSFEGRLTAAFESAESTGLFANTYALENAQEYWAEGVQDWYYTNLESDPPNGIHNFVDRREELLEYDPVLYGLVAELLPDEPDFVDCYSDE